MERVYLDIGALKRPFDDQRQPRIRDEAAAVADIVARAEAGEIALVRSPAHQVENDANPRADRRLAAALWIDGAAVDVPLDAQVESRAGQLVALEFRPLDALHVAFAERAGVRSFVTCDDDLLRLARRLGDALRVAVVAPRALAPTSEP
jgi:predicted nucleic acid-binding protein